MRSAYSKALYTRRMQAERNARKARIASDRGVHARLTSQQHAAIFLIGSAAFLILVIVLLMVHHH